MSEENTARTLMRWFRTNPMRTSRVAVQRLHPTRGSQPYRPLPAPTGTPPYHLSLEEVLPPDAVTAIKDAGRMVFHTVGDTGAVKSPFPQRAVTRQMESDFQVAGDQVRPSFFYHLGDVVYFFGQAEEYYPQFYEPYMDYPAPIFAIPGNHDGDLNRKLEGEGIRSLSAFVDNFCQRIPHHTPDALDAPRQAMTQPNVYWTLDTPFLTIVGLYTNVPEGGQMDESQMTWLQLELANAPQDKALIVALHHPIYSLDPYHSGSVYMHTVLNEAVSQSGRTPDAILTGHVHNYQRYTRPWNERSVPFIVAGAGGYHHLHRLDQTQVPGQLPAVIPDADNVTFESYCDDKWGYLRLEVTPDSLTGNYYAVPGMEGDGDVQATHIDSFTVNLQDHTVTTNPTQ